MKKMLLLTVLLFVFPASLPGREFKSSDGGKALDAQFVRYVPSGDMVTLQVNGRNMVLAAAKFSEEDRKFFEESQREQHGEWEM